MFSELITSIRAEIISELRKRAKGNVFAFRHVNDDGEETIYCDIAVGFPEEDIRYFPDVVQVWGGQDGEAYVTVRDSCGDDRDLKATDIELSTGDLAGILDAIIDGKAVISE